MGEERPSPLRWPTVKRWTPSCVPSTRPSTSRIAPPAPAAAVALDERRVIAVRHEADLVAVRLVRDRQTECPGVRANGVLVQRRRQETDACASCACVSVNRKYDWSFAIVHAALQPEAAADRVAIDARVVPGGDRLRAEALRAGRERRELQVAVAVDARNRRPARGVLLDEVRHDVLAELALEVDDVVGDAEARGDAACVVEVVDGAAAAETRLTAALIVQLHRQADDLVACLRHQRGGHRRVDSA